MIVGPGQSRERQHRSMHLSTRGTPERNAACNVAAIPSNDALYAVYGVPDLTYMMMMITWPRPITLAIDHLAAAWCLPTDFPTCARIEHFVGGREISGIASSPTIRVCPPTHETVKALNKVHWYAPVRFDHLHYDPPICIPSRLSSPKHGRLAESAEFPGNPS